MDRRTQNVLASAVVFLALLLLPALFAGCERGGSGSGGGGSQTYHPPSPAQATFALSGMAQDTFTVLATWAPVEFLGDTVSTYRRTLARTDTDGLALEDTISAVGSETLDVTGPPAGQTASYEYCLWSRAPNEAGEAVESENPSCTSFQYTSPTSFPPPPDSLDVSPQQTVALDSVRVVPDRLEASHRVDASGDTSWTTLAFLGGTRIDSVAGNTYQLRAELYSGGALVGCAGGCDGVVLEPATWDGGIPVVMGGRPGYPAGEEWVARRLPWLRSLG